jgi:crotonobetainyl-CoA:carnitine CoA-transferase CaiB-like acyl-CoA transferase
MGKKLPLEGIRILDFCHIWVGPYASQLLADWGAEVIWVESRYHSVRGQARPNPKAVAQGQAFGYPDKEAGDRPWNRSANINRHARNKLSITVDNRTEKGRDIVRKLMAKSDVILENQVPVTAERYGLTWDEASKANPQIILMNMPAFGLDGPYKNYRTLGSHMEAISGHQIIRAYPHMDPGQLSDVFPADAGGAAAAAAVIMGLVHRKRTGQGLHIEFVTAENFIPYIGDFVMDYTMNNRVHKHEGNQDWSMAPHQVYKCVGDEQWVTIACRDDQDWKAICQVMGNPAWINDPRFTDSLSRYQNRIALDEHISAWTANKDKFWVMDSLQSLGVPSGAVFNEQDAYADPHLEERGFFEKVSHPDAGTHSYPGIQWKLSKTPNKIRRHAPQLGQDNEYIYKEVLEYNDTEYEELISEGHIGMEYDESVP